MKFFSYAMININLHICKYNIYNSFTYMRSLIHLLNNYLLYNGVLSKAVTKLYYILLNTIIIVI